jgi:3-oxoadipate enol-lactonase
MLTGRRLIEQRFVCVPAFCRVNQASSLTDHPGRKPRHAICPPERCRHPSSGDRRGPGPPTIVFANSLGTDYRIWRDVIVRMVGDYSIIAYDKRGHGLSELGDAEITMDDHVNDLIALIEHFEAKNVIICGLSVGGMIAQGVAAKRPDLVRAMILCDTGHKIGTPDMWNARITAINEQGIAAISDAILERWFAKEYRSADNADFVGYRMMLERTPGGRLCRHLCRDSRQRFHQVEFGACDAGHLRGGNRGRFDPAIAGGGNGAADPGRDVPGRSREPHICPASRNRLN